MVHLQESITINAPLQRCFDLARNVEVHLAGNTHFGEQALAAGGVTTGLINLHQSVTWRAKHFGLWHSLTSQITALDPPFHFRDEMLAGPFRSMRHDHSFESLADGRTKMKDTFRFAAPLPLLGVLAEHLVLRRYMRTLLRERMRVIRNIAESDAWTRYLPAAIARQAPGNPTCESS